MSKKICTWCGNPGKTQSAHMISKRLGRIIAVLQLGEPIYEYEQQIITLMMHSMRKRTSGEIRLCPECHDRSDRLQEKMVNKLGELLQELRIKE